MANFKKKSEKGRGLQVLREVRRRGLGGKDYMILDNFSSHGAKDTRKKAEEPRIELVFLQPHLLDSNPTEWIWRGIKR